MSATEAATCGWATLSSSMSSAPRPYSCARSIAHAARGFSSRSPSPDEVSDIAVGSATYGPGDSGTSGCCASYAATASMSEIVSGSGECAWLARRAAR